MSFFKDAARAWLGIPPPALQPAPRLWPVIPPGGGAYGREVAGNPTIYLFEHPDLAERHVLDAGLESHVVGAPLVGEALVAFLDGALKEGLTHAAVNPSGEDGAIVEGIPLREVRDRVLALWGRPLDKPGDDRTLRHPAWFVSKDGRPVIGRVREGVVFPIFSTRGKAEAWARKLGMKPKDRTIEAMRTLGEVRRSEAAQRAYAQHVTIDPPPDGPPVLQPISRMTEIAEGMAGGD